MASFQSSLSLEYNNEKKTRVLKNLQSFEFPFIFVPTHLSEGGTIYSIGFFVQTILADRYKPRREL